MFVVVIGGVFLKKQLIVNSLAVLNAPSCEGTGDEAFSKIVRGV